MPKPTPLLLAFAALMISGAPAVLAQDSLTGSPVELAVDRNDLGPSPSGAYRNQTAQQRQSLIEINGELNRAADNTWQIRTDNKTYRILNPEPWISEDWFDDETTIQLYGNLRSDIEHDGDTPVVVASHIFQVKVSPVQNTRDRIEQEVRDQLTKENAQKYADRIPFLKKILDRLGW